MAGPIVIGVPLMASRDGIPVWKHVCMQVGGPGFVNLKGASKGCTSIIEEKEKTRNSFACQANGLMLKPPGGLSIYQSVIPVRNSLREVVD